MVTEKSRFKIFLFKKIFSIIFLAKTLRKHYINLDKSIYDIENYLKTQNQPKIKKNY